MSDDEGKGNPSDVLANLRQPMPLPEKLAKIARNRAIALRHGCCGHPGEPGC
jgi:hypothetical protein